MSENVVQGHKLMCRVPQGHKCGTGSQRVINVVQGHKGHKCGTGAHRVITSLDPRPSDLCILMEGLVRDDHVA